ncbi:MAG: serine/threonine-protein phosphatase [Muribaculaceae bacterium]|nr:serine/threonine-protein phosphatase [Muribaculaceae bacterium]
MEFSLQPYNLQELGQRSNQEDALFPGIDKCTPNDRLFILCDGMGGHEKGEVASSTVCEAMSDYILKRWKPSMPLSDMLLKDALNYAFDALDTKDGGGEKKMGTTMTFLCFHAAGVTVAHIGDSRVYQLRPARNGVPAQIVFRTRDHSLVNDLIAVGEITEEEAKNHPQKNVITRAMQPGQQPRVNADIKHLTDVKAGDYFYMCSDGMLEQTSDDNLLYIVTKSNTDDREKMEMLREVTEDNSDNHTAHLIKVEKVEGTPAAQPPVYRKSSTSSDEPQSKGPSYPKGRQIKPIQEEKNHSIELPQPSKIIKILLAICAVLLILVVILIARNCSSKSSEEKEPEKQEQVARDKATYYNAEDDKKNNTNDDDDENGDIKKLIRFKKQIRPHYGIKD